MSTRRGKGWSLRHHHDNFISLVISFSAARLLLIALVFFISALEWRATQALSIFGFSRHLLSLHILNVFNCFLEKVLLIYWLVLYIHYFWVWTWLFLFVWVCFLYLRLLLYLIKKGLQISWRLIIERAFQRIFDFRVSNNLIDDSILVLWRETLSLDQGVKSARLLASMDLERTILRMKHDVWVLARAGTGGI